MSHRTINLGLIAGIFGSCALGCAHEVESPKLTVQSVGPDLLCNAQRLSPEASLLVSGSGFTPMPTNVLAEPAILKLPNVSLTRSADLSGAAASDAPVTFSGDPAGEHAAELSRLALGPGGLFGELFPQWAPMKHATTGDTHLGGMSLFVGYRAAL